jgi:hypothetical protein
LANDLNIQSEQWNSVNWQKGKMLVGLGQLRTCAEDQAIKALNWYYAKKRSKNILSRWLRFWAIFFTILGGLIPILAATGLGAYIPALLQVDELQFNQFGYVFIGFAAGCVAFDRFFGFSTNWMRYIGAAMRIETARVRFLFEWEQLVAPLKGEDPSDDKVRDILEAIQKFSLTIREAIEQETGAWITEFQTNLSQLDKETKALFESAQKEKQAMKQKGKERAHQGASIEVKITNFKDLDDGWSVAVDDSTRAEDVTSESQLLKPFQPGHYQVSSTGRIGGNPVHASESIEIKAGKLCKLSLTLK